MALAEHILSPRDALLAFLAEQARSPQAIQAWAGEHGLDIQVVKVELQHLQRALRVRLVDGDPPLLYLVPTEEPDGDEDADEQDDEPKASPTGEPPWAPKLRKLLEVERDQSALSSWANRNAVQWARVKLLLGALVKAGEVVTRGSKHNPRFRMASAPEGGALPRIVPPKPPPPPEPKATACPAPAVKPAAPAPTPAAVPTAAPPQPAPVPLAKVDGPLPAAPAKTPALGSDPSAPPSAPPPPKPDPAPSAPPAPPAPKVSPPPPAPAPAPAGQRKTLAEAADQIARTRSGAGTGALRVAEILVPLLERWEDYREEAGGLDGTTWAARVTGDRQAASNAKRRVEAMALLERELGGGPLDRDFVRYQLHDQVLLHVAGKNVPAEQRKAALLALHRETRASGGMLAPAKAERVLRKAIERTPLDKPSALAAFVAGPLDAWMASALEAARAGKLLPPMPDLPPQVRGVDLTRTRELLSRKAQDQEETPRARRGW